MNAGTAFQPLLVMKHIRKEFSGIPVLDDVSFDLAPGEVHVLAGENGAGKSTLIKIAGGIYADYGGSVECGGRPVRFTSARDAFAGGVSVMHQELSLVPAMSVSDNIFLGRELRRYGVLLDGRAQEARACAALEKMGLDIDVSLPAERYPLAVRQMIEIAKALSFDAKVIIMDEPTSALSEPEAGRLFEIMRELKAQGRGIVFISHKLEEIYTVADRITVLRDGRLTGSAKVSEMGPDELIRLMAGKEIGKSVPTARKPHNGNARVVVRDMVLTGSSGRNAANGVTFAVHAGEVVGLAGLRGSGASELLNALFGAEAGRIRGSVIVNGEPVLRFSPGRLMRRGCMLVTNDRKRNGFVPGMSILHNITLAALKKFSPLIWIRHGLEKGEAERMMRELHLRAASMLIDTSKLSGGNIQKVILGKWLLTGPTVLLLDDPTRGIDVGTKEEIYGLIRRMADAGCAVLFTSSELEEIMRLSDRVIVMHRGRISAEMDHAAMDRAAVLKAALGGGTDEPVVR